MKRFLLVTFFVVFASFAARLAARNVVDVDSVGDLWIFAIDKSGSMNDRLSAGQIYVSVSSQLEKLGILDRPDYSHDHFCFYNTGIHNGPTLPNGRILLRCYLDVPTHFVKLFVRPGLQYNARFEDKSQLLAALKKEVVSDYPYKYSFVSQIRTCVLADAITRFRKSGLSSCYKNVFVVTITDDGDVNDQWRRDYKEMRHASIRKLEEVNRLNTKYVYNPLTQSGGGMLKEECASYDPSVSKPHVWLHSYSTGQSRASAISDLDTLLNIKASDGHRVKCRLISRSFNGDSVCFVYIDSILVNGDCLQVKDYMTNNDTAFEFSFDNSLKRNDVQMYGSIQVFYADSIYGDHFKKYPFVYTVSSFSKVQVTLFIVVVSLLSLALLLFLVTALFVRTNLTLFRMYLPDGKIVRARRGFKSQWKDDVIPLMSVKRGNSSLIKCGNSSVINRLRNVYVSQTERNSSDKILLVSSFRLNFSFDVECYDTSVDIDGNFSLHSDDYNSMLKSQYQGTVAQKLFKFRRNHRQLTHVCDALIYLYNLVCKRYYYLVPYNYSGSDVSFESDILRKKIFLIEFWQGGNNDNAYVTEKESLTAVVNDILYEYYEFYTGEKRLEQEYLIRYQNVSDRTIWYVIQLDYEKIKYHSFRNARVVLYYEQQAKCLDSEKIKTIKRLVRLTRSRKVDIAEWKVQRVSESDFFDVHLSNCMSFISMIDGAGKKFQQLISPFEDGDSVRKFVRLKRSNNDGYLYSSLLPLAWTGVDTAVKISGDIIRINIAGTVKLDMERGKITFMGKTIKCQ